MNKTVVFHHVHFDSATIRAALELMEKYATTTMKELRRPENGPEVVPEQLTVARIDERWTFDSLDIFLADLAKADGDPSFESAVLAATVRLTGLWSDTKGITWLQVNQAPASATVSVTGDSQAIIEKIHSIFAEAAARLRKPPLDLPRPKPKIFIGHGGSSSAWQQLSHDLHHSHGLEVEGFEMGSRGGLTINAVLESMMAGSNFAILVMSAEDVVSTGSGAAEDAVYRARQNVVHELGLFQGRLGFNRVLALRETGTEMFSNLAGTQYVAFDGDIKVTYGEILAAIRREFGSL